MRQGFALTTTLRGQGSLRHLPHHRVLWGVTKYKIRKSKPRKKGTPMIPGKSAFNRLSYNDQAELLLEVWREVNKPKCSFKTYSNYLDREMTGCMSQQNSNQGWIHARFFALRTLRFGIS